jgi:uncharacterized protein (TIGR02266 family)
MWNGLSRSELVRELVQGLGELFPGATASQLTLALPETEAHLELRVEAAEYPRAQVERFGQAVVESGGTLVELWRLPPAQRETFRASSVGGSESFTVDGFETAAGALEEHVTVLAFKDPLPSGPPEGPPTPKEEPAQAPAPPVSPGATQRRGRRFAVRLEMEFRSELEFVQEHATNISNGGLFVRTAHRPPMDSVVTVSVKLPNGERLQGEALVVHVVDDPYNGGVGLTFLSDDPAFVETLDRYLVSLADT